MPYLRPLLILGSVILCTAIAQAVPAPAPAPSAEAAQSLTRTLYATVTDEDGNPITDMTAADFEVEEGGETQEINVRLATAPLRVAVIVADRGAGTFQGAALRFVEGLLGNGEFSITALVTQPERLTDYTGEVDGPGGLREGLLQLGKRGVSRGGVQLVEAIQEILGDIKREGWRSAILVMRNGGEGPTSTRADRVRDQLRDSGAVLYAVSTAGAVPMGGGGGGTQQVTAQGVSQQTAQSEWAEGSMTLATILGDGSKDSGGRHEQNVSSRLIPTVQQIALELLNQYEITYTLPDGTRPSDRVSVSTERDGVSLQAPSRIAN